MLGLLAISMILFRPDASPPRITAADARRIAIDLKRHPDAILTAPPVPITRNGGTLKIGDIRLIDTGDCELRPECERYRLDAVWPDGLIGVSFSGYESSDYWLVTRNTATAIGTRPIPSPSGRYLFVAFSDDLNGQSDSGIPESISIWRSDDLERIRTVDAPILRYAFPAFAAWHGDDCIEFAAVPPGATPSAARHYWLTRGPLDWTLNDNRPSNCPAD